MRTLQVTLLPLLSVAVLCVSAVAGGQPGRVLGWGVNDAGQATGIPSCAFSNGAVVVTDNPYATGAVMIAGQALGDAVAVVTEGGFSLALRADGTVVGWGDNHAGRARGVETPFPGRTGGPVIVGGQTLSNVVSVAAGNSFGLALKQDSTVVAWGKNHVPAGLSDVVAISAQGRYSVALRRDGTVASWCSTPPVQSQVPATLSNAVAIACGGGDYERSMALRRDGTVVVWKAGIPSEEPVPPEVRDVVAIAAGGSHSLALKRDGTVFGWGFNGDGQATGVPTKTAPDAVGFTSGLVTTGGRILSNIVAIAAAGRYSLALKGDGTVVAWGDKRCYRGVPAGLSGVVAIAAAPEGLCLAITTNTAAWSANR